MQRTKAIDKVTSLILLDPVNTIDGRALIESINSEPITDIDPQLEKQVEDQRKTRITNSIENDVKKAKEKVVRAVSVIILTLVGETTSLVRFEKTIIYGKSKNASMRECWGVVINKNRLWAVYDFMSSDDASFPLPSGKLEYYGFTLEEWLIVVENLVIET